MILLMPAMIDHPNGVVTAEAVVVDKFMAVKPPPAAMHQPNNPKAATGMVTLVYRVSCIPHAWNKSVNVEDLTPSL